MRVAAVVDYMDERYRCIDHMVDSFQLKDCDAHRAPGFGGFQRFQVTCLPLIYRFQFGVKWVLPRCCDDSVAPRFSAKICQKMDLFENEVDNGFLALSNRSWPSRIPSKRRSAQADAETHSTLQIL